MSKEFVITKKLTIKERVVFSNPSRLLLGEVRPFLGSLEGDAYAILRLDPYGEVGLVQKSRPYVEGPADMMMVPFYRPVSLITECTPDERHKLFALSGHLVELFERCCPHDYPVIAINQQSEGTTIPGKYAEDGTELKVQTIDQLHFHIFMEDKSGEPKFPIFRLKSEDRKDFLDPFSVVATDFIGPMVRQQILRSGLVCDYQIAWNSFPLGIRIFIDKPLSATTQEVALSNFLSGVQTQYCIMYELVASCFLSSDGSDMPRKRTERVDRVNQLVKKYDCLSEFSKRLLSLLAHKVTSSKQENRKYLRFVKGPALTWLLYAQDKQTVVNLSPRILSRGNAMESLGIWKDQFQDASSEVQQEHNCFYRNLLPIIDPQYKPIAGPLLAYQENE